MMRLAPTGSNYAGLQHGLDTRMDFPLITAVLIVILIAIRVFLRRRLRGAYVEVFQTTSRSMSLPETLRDQLKQQEIRYRIVYKGPPNQPFIGMSGEQFISLEVHVEDLGKARPIVSRVLNNAWRGR